MLNILSKELFLDENHYHTYPQNVQTAQQWYKDGRVTIDTIDAYRAQCTVIDDEQKPFRVKIVPDIDMYTKIHVQCNCKERRWGMCTHGLASIIAVRTYLTEHPPSRWQGVLAPVVESTGSTKRKTPNMIFFSFQSLERHFTYASLWQILPYILPVSLFEGEDEDILDNAEALDRIIQEQKLSTKARRIRQRISPQDYAHLPIDVVVTANLTFGSSTQSSYASDAGTASLFESVFALLPKCIVYFGTEKDPLQTRLPVLPNAGTIGLALDRCKEGLSLSPMFTLHDPTLNIDTSKGHFKMVIDSPLWFIADNKLIHLEDPSRAGALLLEHPDTVIAPHEIPLFLESYLYPIANDTPVGGDAIVWDEVTTEPVPRMYLTDEEGNLHVQIRFGYGDYEVPYEHACPDMSVRALTTHAESDKQTGFTGSILLARVHRQPEREQEAWQKLTSHGLRLASKNATHMVLKKGTNPIAFLMNQVPRLVQEGYEVYGEKDLSLPQVNRNKPKMSFRVSSGTDWFDVQAVGMFGDIEVALKDIKRAIRKQERYIKLADGTIGAIPDEWLKRYRHLFELSQDTKKGLRVSQTQAALLDDVLSDAGAEVVQADEAFHRRMQELRSFEHITPKELPQQFHASLRPYQKAGYDWLHFLHTYKFGGCLADDMGTGKTVQTLAFLQSLYEWQHTKAATLIVMPRSLLFNWARESERFAPNLRVFTHADQNRIQEPNEFGTYHLILTTYGVMLRDVELLKQYTFHYVVLDESQAVKNPAAETSKAARELSAEHRLTLTGTPIENTTTELWSQFAFLNPGMLGSLEYFRREFVTPIEQKRDMEAAHTLRKMVFPFILRRTKDQVVSDLPPRSERVLVSDMEPEQRKLYEEKRDYYRAVVLGMLEEDGGMEQARFKILEGLLRLRQICNHPRLVDEHFQGGSSKFDLLLDTLETLRSEGHKALVFSQFVEMLSLVRQRLEEHGIPYAYLDGKTRNRQEVVDRFQNDPDLPFFLISLKAGGVGLNLTAADYVIHVDPWWNPAVEMQATDRTHRIGQDKPVFVYKLVVRDSVEEKVLMLQERKRAVVEQVIATEGSVFKELSPDDIEALFT